MSFDDTKSESIYDSDDSEIIVQTWGAGIPSQFSTTSTSTST
ncbi:3429_t:CDS:1, partial [Gigaspora margarita]